MPLHAAVVAAAFHPAASVYFNQFRFRESRNKCRHLSFKSTITLPPSQRLGGSSNPNLSNLRNWSLKALSGGLPSDSSNDSSSSSSSSIGSGLLGNARLIALATIASKFLGLLREMLLAAAFGVGPVVSAYKHALVVPSFFTTLIGGVNGPIHITSATVLSKLSGESRKLLIQDAHVVMLLIGSVLSACVYIFAELVVHLSAPGLWDSLEGQVIKSIAVTQLKVMAPCILFAGSVGLGFGSLSAEGDNITPSLSPILTNIPLLVVFVIDVLISDSDIFCGSRLSTGGIFISSAASVGVLLQWLTQMCLLEKSGYKLTFFSWKNILDNGNLLKLYTLAVPAVLTSGLAQVASITDLYFASFIPGAAAGLSYARILAMAPLGIILSTVLLPIIPIISRLSKSSSWPTLKETVQQTILLCTAMILPLTSALCLLAEPSITFLFQRYAFDSTATVFVSSLLICYAVSLPFHVVREVVVVVFYSLDDGRKPFAISLAAILLNAVLDWLFTFKFCLGAQGLVLSTSLVTALSSWVLMDLLSRKLKGLVNFKALVGPFLLQIVCAMISGYATFVAHKMISHLLFLVSSLRFLWLCKLLSICFAVLVGIITFCIPLAILKVPEMILLENMFIRFFK